MITFFLSLLKGNSNFFFFKFIIFNNARVFIFLFFPYPLFYIVFPPLGIPLLALPLIVTSLKLFQNCSWLFPCQFFVPLKKILNGLSLVIHGILNHILFELYPLYVFTHHADCGLDLGLDPI